MKKIILIVLMALFMTGCCTKPTPVEPQIIYIEKPLKDPLPHPEMPKLVIGDSKEQIMENVLLMNGAIQKLQLLVEIYEREDRKLPEGYGNKKYENMTLEQLIEEYMKLIGEKK